MNSNLDIKKYIVDSEIKEVPTRRSRKSKVLLAILTLVVIILGYILFYLFSTYNTIVVGAEPFWKDVVGLFNRDYYFGTDEPQEFDLVMPEPEESRFDLLVLGIRGHDQVSIEQEGGLLTDTIMVLSYDELTGNASMISIPRDLYIKTIIRLDDGTHLLFQGKLNEAYERGLSIGQGLSYASSVVSKLSGVYIDNAILFDFNSFQSIIDDLGGITVNLNRPFSEPNQWGYEFYLPEGENHLNGEQTLYYARSRNSSSDFARASRQQQILLAVKNKALNLGILANPIKIHSLLTDLKAGIRTNFSFTEIDDAISLARKLSKGGSIKRYVLHTDNVLFETRNENGSYILLPVEADFSAVMDVFAFLLVTPTPTPELAVTIPIADLPN